ncbi:MAG: hypothetical protein RMJ19_03630, partial [Gemmatales bacterium]|nr:hypothetical protein [Gemmatales bacterium]MDW8174737.1 hypothetical protein [Gemmatales bacterium]
LGVSLLTHADHLPTSVFQTIYIESKHLTPEKLSNWLQAYDTIPQEIAASVMMIFLHTKDSAVRKAIVSWLAKAKPGELDEIRFKSKIEQYVQKLLNDPNIGEELVMLVAALPNSDHIMNQLARHPNPKVRYMYFQHVAENAKQGILELLPCLSKPQDQENVKQVIKDMFDKYGPEKIEPQVLQALQQASLNDPIAAVALLEILRDKGTKKSSIFLSFLTKHNFPPIAKAAAEALAAIKKRGN